ncbi:uncharacterized protein LOC122026572 [Zingiber officinale]|uniref:uncharacterized protein LOC122026572 n=1 Tax=Zingiber officinale TaxID=94328 RepID=UPI001C4C8B4E|nr:uncharacterized protein LOC122026572 [Zingiber officinale]
MSSLAPLTTANSCPGTFILSSLSGANPFALQGVRSSQRNVSRVQIAAPRTTPSISPATGRFLTVNLCSKNEQPEVEVIHCEDKKELPCNLDERNSKASKGFSLNGIMQRLKRYGVAGVLSYGLLNTVYYLTTFLLVWELKATTGGLTSCKVLSSSMRGDTVIFYFRVLFLTCAWKNGLSW